MFHLRLTVQGGGHCPLKRSFVTNGWRGLLPDTLIDFWHGNRLGLDLWMVNYKYIPFVLSVSWKGPFLHCKSHFEVMSEFERAQLESWLGGLQKKLHQLLVYRLDSWFRVTLAQSLFHLSMKAKFSQDGRNFPFVQISLDSWGERFKVPLQLCLIFLCLCSLLFDF